MMTGISLAHFSLLLEGWWLDRLWVGIYSVPLFLLVYGIVRWTPKAPMSLHNGLWRLVLLRLMLPADLGLNLPIPELPASMSPVFAVSHEVVEPVLTTVPAPSQSVLFELSFAWLWLLGMILLPLLYIGKYLKVRKLIREARPLADTRLSGKVRYLQSVYRIQAPVQVLVGPTAEGPFVTGLFRFVIYLPKTLMNADMDTLHAVLAHEMAHIRRRDQLVALLEFAVVVFNFFNPLVWYLRSRLAGNREMACDLSAMRHGGFRAADYGRALLSVARGASALPVQHLHDGLIKPRLLFLSQKERHMWSFRRHIGYLFFVPIVATGVLLSAYSAPENNMEIIPQSVAPTLPLFIDPLPSGYVSSHFGPRINPFKKNRAMHTGTDLVASRGTAVLAAADGTVIGVSLHKEKPSAYGTWVRVDHGSGFSSFYAHLDRADVRVGDTVKSGQAVGALGNSGRSTGPHLHFELALHGRQVDAGEYISEFAAKRTRP